MIHDLRYAIRSLRRQPGFAAISILTLAVGIGAGTAIFSVVDATLLRPLPFKDSERLMQLSIVTPAMFGHHAKDLPLYPYPKYRLLRDLPGPFDGFAAADAFVRKTFAGGSDPELVNGEIAEADYFTLLGVTPRYGRTFLPEEDSAGASQRVVILGHGFWQRAFGGNPAALGRTVSFGGDACTVIGILGPGFRGLSGNAEFWLPVAMAGSNQLSKGNHAWTVVARRKIGVSEAQAKAAMSSLGAQMDAAFPDNYTKKKWGASAQSFTEARVEPGVRRAVLVFFAAVGFVLLVACANVANLLLARSTARRREIAVRKAIGGSRRRIVRQLLVESAVLATAGGIAGILLASWAVRALTLLNTGGENPLVQKLSGLTRIGLNSIALDARVLAFAIGAAALACFVSGLAPALRAARSNMIIELKAGGSGSGHPASNWFGGTRVVVIAEVALAVVLVSGASLMIRSFGRLLAIRTGVDADNLLTVRMNTGTLMANPGAKAFIEQLQSRIASLPGVTSVGARDSFPLSSCCSTTTAWLPGRPASQRAFDPLITAHAVSPEYFRTMRIPLVRGRLFTAADGASPVRTIVISESAARKFWPGENPLGKRLSSGQGGAFQAGAEVIGVVADVRNRRPEEPDMPSLYYCDDSVAGLLATLFIRTTGNPTALAPVVRQMIRAANPNLPIIDMKTMRERISDAGSKARLGATLLGIFAAVALVLAAIGVYGVISCSVAQRTREMGIRIALGARPSSLAGLVLKRGLGMTAAGLAAGIPAALALTRLMSSLLFEVKATDMISYVVTAAVLLAAAALACWLPARRAAAADAIIALRTD